MFPTNVLLYGLDAPLPEQVPLRAGPLTLVYEDGGLRSIRLGRHEVLRRVYAAVRDHNWGTAPGVRTNERVEAGTDWFRISYDAAHRQGAIDFRWSALITGDADGTVRLTMDGAAHAAFLRNRIGFCVLHPAACAGAAAVVERLDGVRLAARLPELITPDQPPPPFTDMRALEHAVAPGVTARVAFEGDAFELEDQRNWTDASFKTYSTPLRLPFPVEVPQGARVRQAVTLTLKDEVGSMKYDAAHSTVRADGYADFRLQTSYFLLPTLGLASSGRPLGEREAARLRALRLSHLRAEVDLTRPGAAESVARAAAEARLLGLPLELALLLPDEPGAALRELRAAIERERPPVAAWLVYAARERLLGGTPIEAIVRAARGALAGYADAPFAAGTGADYIFAGRNPPPTALIDRFCTAVSPQVHAFDLASVTETLAAQEALVRSARATFGLPVAVSPVTLMPRANPYATAAPPEPAPGALPPQVDVRQMSLFGAGWTVGSIARLAAGGAASVTYYETTGWRGVMETAQGSPLPQVFRSIPGAVFPLYHVLADVGEFAGGDVLASVSSDPLRFEGLALRRGGRARALLASYTAEPQQVAVRGLAGDVRVRPLDASNAERAMREPEAFRAEGGETRAARGDALEIVLPPFAVARIDWQVDDGG